MRWVKSMNSQDIFTDCFHLFYTPTLAGYFANQFKQSQYDVDQLRKRIDTTHFSESCTHKVEGVENLQRKDKAEIILDSIKQLRLDFVPEFIAIVFAGLAIIGSSDKMDTDMFNKLTNVCIVLSIPLFIHSMHSLYMYRVNQRLSDALEIIIKEEENKQKIIQKVEISK